MATLCENRFTQPEVLSGIARDLLQNFLHPYRTFLEGRGLPWEQRLDLEKLSQILMEPGEDTPRDLLDALYCVSEMTSPEAREAVEEEAAQIFLIPADREYTVAELALLLWMLNPEGLRERHAELSMVRSRTFEYFSPIYEGRATPLEGRSLKTLEGSLATWFVEHRYGAGAKVYKYPRGEEVWFLIRRGGRYRRQATLENGQSGCVGYRPEKYDVVVFNQFTQDLGINCRSRKMQELYRKVFGEYLFGRSGQFSGSDRFTLEPLRYQGADSLRVGDVPGLVWIKLVGLEYLMPIPGTSSETLLKRHPDVFEALQFSRTKIESNWTLKKAVFKVQFADHSTARLVTIKPSNVALYTRDDDARVVEQWMLRRGFLASPNQHELVQLEMPMVMS